MLEDEIPNVQRAIPLGGEEDGGTSGTPTAVSHVMPMLPKKETLAKSYSVLYISDRVHVIGDSLKSSDQI